MPYYPASVQRLLDELEKLPAIGPKSAQRIAFHLLRMPAEETGLLARAIDEVKERVTFCTRCFNFAEGDLCVICQDPGRDRSIICVVEEPRDVVAFERTGEYRGDYHVLQGAISPMDNVGPDEIRIKELLDRIQEGQVSEVVVATNPNTEGETTAMYLAKIIKPLGIDVTRIASGLPVGGDLEYADEVTLGRALQGRRNL